MSSGGQSVAQVCRICRENIPSGCGVLVFGCFENAIVADLIAECSAVELNNNDGLPDRICEICLGDLQSALKFVRKVRDSDCALREHLQKYIKIESDATKKDKDSENLQDDKYSIVLHKDDHSDDGDWNCSDASDDSKQEISKNKSLSELEAKSFKTIEIDRDKCLCCSCLQQFESENILKSHLKEAHPIKQEESAKKKFTCPYCPRRYSSAVAMKFHKRKMEALERVYECLECQVRFYDPQKRHHHAKSHEKKVPAKVEKQQPSLEELVEQHGHLCCALGCSESFETDAQLLAHAHSTHRASRVEASNDGKMTECSICLKRFKDDECLQRHLRFKYKPTKNICTLCGSKFPSLSSLTIHERSHTKEKPFECEICTKAFGDKQSLKRHHVKHTQDKPFMCSACGISFKRKRAMQSHMIIHESGGQLPFKCELCEKRFRIKAKMLYHMRTHTGEKPYPCRYCDKSFADFSNRMRHEMSHTGEKPYKCSYCPSAFITRRFMLEHEKAHKRSEEKQANDLS